jgi:hypothetical protein
MITKLNHYVPQSYLARFAAPDGLLWVFDKETLDARRLTPKSTGAEKHLYTIKDEAGENSDRIEREIMSPIDGNAVPILDRWTQRGYRFASEELPVMAQYMAIQHTRVPRNLELINELGVAHLLKDSKEIADDPQRFKECFEYMQANRGDLDIGDEEELKRLLRNPEESVAISMNRKLALGFSLMMAKDFHYELSRMYWSIVDSPDDCQFITSDSPVVSYAEDDEGRLQFGANFVSPRFEVIFPLSPKVCVYLRKRHGQYRYRCGRSLVQKLNRRTACMAERFIYAQSDFNVHSLVQEFAYTRRQPKVNRQELYESMERIRRQRILGRLPNP